MLAEPLQVVAELGVILDRMGIAWAVGGSIASSLHGVPRSTQDVDILVAIGGGDLDRLAHEASPAFMVDADMGRSCLRIGQAFNILSDSAPQPSVVARIDAAPRFRSVAARS